jgi:iron only hydrogenase large subunit-like protein/nitrogen-specific signal transduction histidine kinase
MTIPYITTIAERCRMCYTCVRECPAKAIRVADGQAEVIAQRCIACGNCVRLCSQEAKQIRSGIESVSRLLSQGHPVSACIAPSFPAEFTDMDYDHLVGMIRALGFDWVHEVSFGADLVARQYRRLMSETNGRRFVATTCPALVGYVERYHPELVPTLAPIVSPMIAMARVVRRRYGEQARVVFIGPCIAKKCEADDLEVANEVDAVLTFAELRAMFRARGLRAADVDVSEFDPPHGATGALYPISRGFLQAADLSEDLMTGEIVATQGRTHMIDALQEFSDGDLGAKLLEVLCCEGCIMGAGISNDWPLFFRRRQVRKHVCRRVESLDRAQWCEDMEQLADLDLRRTFAANDQRIRMPAREEIDEIMARMGKYAPKDELNCGACGYDTCREHATAIYKGLAESEMCLPSTIDQLKITLKELAESHGQLASAQEALVQSEKLASMGQLAAGIAHEVNNPLGVVLVYAHLLLEDCTDSAIRDDLTMIAEQADRCKKIVAGLLHFARQNRLSRSKTDVADLVNRAVRTIPMPERVRLRVECLAADPTAEVDRDQVLQVLTNLIGNAVAAMEEGGDLTIRIGGDAERITIEISDTGIGIPEENIKKVFDPFFTTKPQGTGLGLAVTYGIVKMHCGDIRVQSNADRNQGPTGTTFTVRLPRHE